MNTPNGAAGIAECEDNDCTGCNWCNGVDPEATYTLIEFMPAQHRSSHIKARNAGTWPHNGAERVYVEGDIDNGHLHARWASVIEDSIRGVDLPPGADVRQDIPEEALPEVRDLEDEAACRADYQMDAERDDRLTGDR